MIYYSTLLVFLSLLRFKNVLGNTCTFSAKVSQSLLNEGFHRNITYGIVFSSSDEVDTWMSEDCIIALDQTLPPGVYANPDELGEFRRSNKLNAIPKNIINVELPAEQSEASGVYIVGLVADGKVYLWLPVHARYHRAMVGGGTARNIIEPPKLYLRCPDQRFDVCGKAISPSVTFLCNGSPRDKCSWKEISYTMTTGALVWAVPVGSLDHYYPVAAGTALVILAGSMYLLRAIHDYKIESNKKRL